VAKAAKLLKGTVAWREKMGTEGITWDSVSFEGATGKTYRLRVRDRRGRPVLCLRPGLENSKDHVGQIRHLVRDGSCEAAACGICGEQRLWPAAALTLLRARRYTTWSLLCARWLTVVPALRAARALTLRLSS
jgi:hypothetical protein